MGSLPVPVHVLLLYSIQSHTNCQLYPLLVSSSPLGPPSVCFSLPCVNALGQELFSVVCRTLTTAVEPESLFLAEQESARVACCALHGDVCTGPITNHIHQILITELLNKVLIMLGELCDLNYNRTDFQSLENPGIHERQGILKMLLFMQSNRQGEQGIKCSLVYVNISACSYFWHITKWLAGGQDACMACLSCRVAELETHWQQWLFCAGGTVSMKEFVSAWYTDCFTIRSLPEQWINFPGWLLQAASIPFAEEKEAGLCVCSNNKARVVYKPAFIGPWADHPLEKLVWLGVINVIRWSFLVEFASVQCTSVQHWRSVLGTVLWAAAVSCFTSFPLQTRWNKEGC